MGCGLMFEVTASGNPPPASDPAALTAIISDASSDPMLINFVGMSVQ